jgi:hypothetical protein
VVDIALSAEQIRSAPREVKEWIRATLLNELALASGPRLEESSSEGPTLAECSPQEAGLVLDRIRDDYLASQVFFELGRDHFPEKVEASALHRIPLAEILRHTRLQDFEHVAMCLQRIGEAFQEVRGDPSAVLFAFDRMGGVYIHDTTRRSVKALWQALVTSRLARTSEVPEVSAPVSPRVPTSVVT